MSLVYLKKTTKYKDLIHILNELNPKIRNKKIFIKPNIVIPISPNSGVITHPEIIRELIKYFKNIGTKEIYIGEIPGLGVDIDEMYLKSGYLKMAKEEGVILLNLLKEDSYSIKWNYGSFKIPKIVKESYYINVAKLKTHSQSTVTLGLKNQKGLLDDKTKKQIHLLGLHKPIAELSTFLKPDLTIIDGVTGIEGDGPLTGGRLVKSNVIIVSDDVVSADSIGCKVMGIDPYKVEYIRIAFKLKVGDINPEVKGDSLNDVKLKFKRANEIYFKFFKIVLWRNPYACSMCGDTLKEAILKVIKNPKYWVKGLPKIFYWTFIRGLDFVIGFNARFPANSSKLLVCVGKCTHKLYNCKEGIFLEGCPPTEDEIIKKLFS